MAGSNYGGGVQFSQVMSNAPAVMNPAAIVGSQPPQPWARSVLDARRQMLNRTPNSEYPSGYL